MNGMIPFCNKQVKKLFKSNKNICNKVNTSIIHTHTHTHTILVLGNQHPIQMETTHCNTHACFYPFIPTSSYMTSHTVNTKEKKKKNPHTTSLHSTTCNHIIPFNCSSNLPPSLKHLHPPSCMHEHVWKMGARQVTWPKSRFKLLKGFSLH